MSTKKVEIFMTYACIITWHVTKITLLHRVKGRVSLQAGAFDGDSTPLTPSQKPAGPMVTITKFKGAVYKKEVEIKIKVLRWIVVLLRLTAGRRGLQAGEFRLDEYEMKNTYMHQGSLMWRGRKLLQAATDEVNEVKMAGFDKETGVRPVMPACTVESIHFPRGLAVSKWHCLANTTQSVMQMRLAIR
jgi:hypothetical protein